MSKEQMINRDEIEIDLLALLHALWRKAGIIAICFIIGVAGSGVVTKFLITPMYQSTAMIYILGNATSISSSISLQLSQQLTVDFTILATSRPVVNQAIAELDSDLTYNQVIQQVKVENPSESSILKITATSSDPQEAADLANAMADATANRVSEVMDMDKPTTVEEAVKPKNPSSPNLLKNMALGGILGALLVCAFITVRFIMDDTIKSEEDVRKYLNLNTLAAIPREKKKKSA